MRHSLDVGTHTLFVGEVVDAAINDDEARPASMSDTTMKHGGVKRGRHERVAARSTAIGAGRPARPTPFVR